jgi:hypothetical protein
MRDDGEAVRQRELLVLDLRQFVRGLRVGSHAGARQSRNQYEAKIAKGSLHRFSPWWESGKESDVRIIREIDVDRD